ncbi:MAG TPA: L-threonylcarbamoyladenylate synthase [Casimicrobiaceae bacterium]|nr:L-threonylcarbamoyladenylate synthase [Casimicrobiaceae bacterium]
MKAVIEHPNRASIARAVAKLHAGELIAFPTETVYGLGADASRTDAVRKIFAAKGRPVDHPVIVHLHEFAELANWVRSVPDGARKLALAFWPGPLTLILPRAVNVADAITGGQDTVGIRVPSHPVARALLAEFGGGIAAPSANRFGRISPTTAQHVAEDLGDSVSIILDGGQCAVGIESTIVAFAGDEPMLLRPGAIGTADLERVLGRTLRMPASAAPRAPGTLAAHYAPKTPATLVPPNALHAELEQLAERDEVIAVLARTVARPPEFSDAWIDAPSDPAAYAHDLYANLRALDHANADAILIEAVPAGDEWLAIRDRLERAARGEDDDRD